MQNEPKLNKQRRTNSTSVITQIPRKIEKAKIIEKTYIRSLVNTTIIKTEHKTYKILNRPKPGQEAHRPISRKDMELQKTRKKITQKT